MKHKKDREQEKEYRPGSDEMFKAQGKRVGDMVFVHTIIVTMQ
jgi:hypothetical protein